METHFVAHVETTMQMMNSGYAVMYVKNGSMENVLRSLLHGLSTSSNTNALLVVSRGAEHEYTESILFSMKRLRRKNHFGWNSKRNCTLKCPSPYFKTNVKQCPTVS